MVFQDKILYIRVNYGIKGREQELPAGIYDVRRHPIGTLLGIQVPVRYTGREAPGDERDRNHVKCWNTRSALLPIGKIQRGVDEL